MKKTFSYILAFLILLSAAAAAYFGWQYRNTHLINGMLDILLLALLAAGAILALCLTVTAIRGNAPKGYLGVSIGMILINAAVACALAGLYSLPDEETVPYFYNKTYAEVQQWCDDHNIEMSAEYEYTDLVDKYSVVSQDVEPGKTLKGVTELKFLVSEGPDPDRKVLVPSMLGWNVEDVINFAEENHLLHVMIDFKESDAAANQIIEQNTNGEMRRNESLELAASFRPDASASVTMTRLEGLSYLRAVTWLKQNGIAYEETAEFSDIVNRGYIISSSVKEGTVLTAEDVVNLSVSKGKEVIVGNLLSMTTKELAVWASENNIHLNFEEAYDSSVLLGEMIKTDVEQGQSIEEESTVTVTISKGPLKMPDIKNADEFEAWAKEYGVKVERTDEYNKDVAAGEVIEYSLKPGDVIPNGETVRMKVSKGEEPPKPSGGGSSGGSSGGGSSGGGSGGGNSGGNSGGESGGGSGGGESGGGGEEHHDPRSYTLILQSNWFSGGSYSSTVSMLNSQLSAYEGVNFVYVAKPSSWQPNGVMHEDSPTKAYQTVVEGNTYEIWIVNND